MIGATLTTVVAAGAFYALDDRDAGSIQAEMAHFEPFSSSGTCSVRYVVRAQQQRQFSADLELQGSQWLNTWRLSWNYSGGQRLERVTGASGHQWGTRVTVRGGRGGIRGTGGSVLLQLKGRFSGTNPTPTAFTLNGVRCETRLPGTSTFPPTWTTPPFPRTSTFPPTWTTPPFPRTSTTTTKTPTATSTKTPTTPPTKTPTATPTKNPTATPTTSVSGSAGNGVLGTGRLQYGRTYSGDGTFYGATGEGNCLFDRSSDLMVAAMNAADYANSQACGAYVEATGPKGKVVVKIVDQCPECKAGDIDFSAEAFARIADPNAGRVRISWRLLSPALSGPVAYRYKEGSSQWWCGIQVRNHRNPVRTLEALVGGSWRQLPRESYNYFLSADGSGCGKAIRVTDIYGNQVTETRAVPVSVGVDQAGAGQFGPPR